MRVVNDDELELDGHREFRFHDGADRDAERRETMEAACAPESPEPAANEAAASPGQGRDERGGGSRATSGADEPRAPTASRS